MTRWVVWCETHSEYLVFVGVSGTTWSEDRERARRFDTKPSARTAAERATWLDHRPIVWAISGDEDEADELLDELLDRTANLPNRYAD